MILFINAYQTLYIVKLIACISVCISCLELLACPRQLNDTSLLSWRVAQLEVRWKVGSINARILDALFSYPNVLIIVILRFLAATTLAFDILPSLGEAFLTGLVALLSLALMLRTPFGHDGADQMTLLTFTSLTMAYIYSSLIIIQACLWFLALQTCLSYITSGLAKVIAADWRSGSALIGIFGTTAFGNRHVALYFREHVVLAKWAARFIISIEIMFPLILILPQPLAFLFILLGLGFHIAIALIMGLNTFFWSFIATYPAILYCSTTSSGFLSTVIIHCTGVKAYC